MQRPPHLQNIDPQMLFADPNYNPQDTQKISDQEIQARQKQYEQFQQFQPSQAPPVKDFSEINNAKNFQLNNFKNELGMLKGKIADMERRLSQLSTPQQPQQQQPQQQRYQQPQQPQPQPQPQPQQQPQYFQPPPMGMQQPGGGFQPYRS